MSWFPVSPQRDISQGSQPGCRGGCLLQAQYQRCRLRKQQADHKGEGGAAPSSKRLQGGRLCPSWWLCANHACLRGWPPGFLDKRTNNKAGPCLLVLRGQSQALRGSPNAARRPDPVQQRAGSNRAKLAPRNGCAMHTGAQERTYEMFSCSSHCFHPAVYLCCLKRQCRDCAPQAHTRPLTAGVLCTASAAQWYGALLRNTIDLLQPYTPQESRPA